MTVGERVLQAVGRVERAGGKGVTIVAASKGMSAASVLEAYAAGIRNFGENYLQEAASKFPAAPDDVTWHFIGRLQSNKIAKIAQAFGTIQTIASLDQARKLSAFAPDMKDVFLEVNIAAEPQKAGIPPEDVPEIAELVYDLHNLRLVGLMTMGPENPNAEDARPYFIHMRKLVESLALPGVDKLSMGMTSDYEVAVQEGATHVRIGSGIFGPRTKR